MLMARCVATVPVFAGAVTDGARRQELLAIHSRILRSADISIAPAMQETDAPRAVIADEHGVMIRNSSLRDLVALA